MRSCFAVVSILAVLLPAIVFAQEGSIAEKVYNFDDMLIDGEFRNPQGMFEHSRSEASFDTVLNLSQSFINHVLGDVEETAMRP